jgi:hypothetical protein
MGLINRGIVVVKPKKPFVDWVNRDSPTPLVSWDDLQQDCFTILVPELNSLENALDYVESLKPMLFELELEAWNRDPSTWPEERTSAQFDDWFTLEAHSMVWDIVATPIVKEGSGEITEIAGTWQVVSSLNFDDDYLYVETTPYVTLHQEGTDVRGEFHIALIRGSLSGRLNRDRILFSFEAMDEMDPVNGAGIIMLQGERLILDLLFHRGDEFTFECVPQKE